MEETKHGEKGAKKRFLLPLLLLLLLLIVGGLAAWHFLGSSGDEIMEANAVVGSMPGKSEEQIAAELTQKVSETEVAFSINANAIFETGTDKGNILFENPVSNGKLTRVEIVDNASGEMLYKSGLLEPGSYVPEAALLVDLEPGQYSCTATVYAYKTADKSFIGKVEAGIKVTVKG